eukprot:SAG31_NODE_138_length_22877_cov_29.540917_18_plen_92_part_00
MDLSTRVLYIISDYGSAVQYRGTRVRYRTGSVARRRRRGGARPRVELQQVGPLMPSSDGLTAEHHMCGGDPPAGRRPGSAAGGSDRLDRLR